MEINRDSKEYMNLVREKPFLQNELEDRKARQTWSDAVKLNRIMDQLDTQTYLLQRIYELLWKQYLGGNDGK